jgi:lysophospholipid acyltransferase (LPLAT)-like uncharacterized protein
MKGRFVTTEERRAADPARLLHPLLLASNAALFAAHLAITPTSKVVFRERFVREEEGDRPLIYITWHRFNYVCMPMFMSLEPADRPTVIVHDGVASRAFSHHSSIWMGFEVFMFRRRGARPAREQITEYVRRTGRPIFNLPDSGGPYGVMKPGILEVARAVNARIVPFQVDARPTVVVGRKLRHVLPLPFSRIEVRRGPSLESTATVEECQRALDGLD